MTRPPTSPPPSFIGRHEVETPEHVRLEYELAGVGSRLSAALLDQLIVACWGLAVIVAATVSGAAFGSFAVALWLALWGIGSLGYYTLFEAFRQGQTPGKRWLGIRVVRDTGHAVTFGTAFVRNLLRLADFLPPPYLGGLLLILFHPKSRRLGDMVAGTVVVRDRPEVATLAIQVSTTLTGSVRSGMIELAGPALSENEWRLLSGYRERALDLDPAVLARVEAQLAGRFAERFPVRPAKDSQFLAALHRSESARRAGGVGGMARGRATTRRSPRASQSTRCSSP